MQGLPKGQVPLGGWTWRYLRGQSDFLKNLIKNFNEYFKNNSGKYYFHKKLIYYY